MKWNQLTLDTIGTWPLTARAMVIGMISLIIAGLFFSFDLQPLRVKLQRAISFETHLRNDYQVKYSQIANQAAYQQQIQQLQENIQGLLERLPVQLNIPSLLSEISNAGTQAGLQFNFIKPLNPIVHEYYTVLPITMSVSGNYKQLAGFITQLSALHGIVTLDDFHINRAQLNNQLNNVAGSSTPDKTLLVMQLTIKVYQQSESQKHA